jgi:quinol-cytochrome oxidoreductase complex cytochrome b subunit
MLLLAIIVQILSGFFLGWYFIPEPGLVVELREEMFNDTRYGYEIYSMHVRGVDVIFVLSYLHILKKIYLKNHITAESDGWMLGGYAFLWFHYVVALGICLSGSHLSDLTLTIVANIYWSLFDNVYKTYYVIFTNKHLNVDQLLRLTIFHYFTPWYYLYLVKLHVLFCHESWDADSGENTYEDKSGSYISWFYDALLKEIQDAWYWVIIVYIYFYSHALIKSAVKYSFFERWNIVENDDIRFYGVAPHWYFRPLMGLLVISPTHYEGLMWMGLFFILLAYIPVIYNWYNTFDEHLPVVPMQNSILQTTFFFLFLMSMFTVASMLPCGRYYYEPEGGYVGNPWVKFSFQYIYLYLGWILHHLDLIDHIIFNYTTYVVQRVIKVYIKFVKKVKRLYFRYLFRFTKRIYKFKKKYIRINHDPLTW